jgi:uncharacterized Zn-binding protein involved in type VI secretion
MSLQGVLRATVDYAGGLILTGSPNVFINGKPVVRVGDAVAPHGSGAHGSAVMATGSATFSVNGIPVCRVGDLATCGDVGSPGSTQTIFSG